MRIDVSRAEGMGFEPTTPLGAPDFESARIGRKRRELASCATNARKLVGLGYSASRSVAILAPSNRTGGFNESFGRGKPSVIAGFNAPGGHAVAKINRCPPRSSIIPLI